MTLRAWIVVGSMALALSVPAEVVGSEPGSPDILLYGFEPFGTFDTNPTGALVARLGEGKPGWRSAVLPVVPADAMGGLFELMTSRPRVILGFGVRVDVDGIEVNTAATNWLSMRVDARPPYFGPIEPGLPSSVGLPSKWHAEVTTRLRETGVRHRLSSDAGMHACNLTFFQALIHAEPGARVLFVHVAPDVMTRPGFFEDVQRVIEALVAP